MLRSITDSVMRAGGENRQRIGLSAARSLARLDGRLRDYAVLTKEDTASWRSNPTEVGEIALEIAVKGPSPADVARLDSAIVRVPFRTLPMIDRPYLASAAALAYAGAADKARAMIARYRTEMTDTSIRREQESDLHHTLGEIALAERKPLDAE